jgi:hypothetical protein
MLLLLRLRGLSVQMWGLAQLLRVAPLHLQAASRPAMQ